ncbi:hypothetical protein ACET3Z_027449 [Daucus carota]
MGRHVVISVHLNFLLHPPLCIPPSLSSSHPSDPTRSTRPITGFPQPPDVGNLRGYIHRHPLLRRRRDSRHAVVVAALEDHAAPMALLLPVRYPPLGSGLLLVLLVLPLPLPPHVPHNLPHLPPPQALLLLALQLVNPHPHVIPLARILPIISSPRNPNDHLDLRHRLRLPVLDRNRSPRSLLPICYELSDYVVNL